MGEPSSEAKSASLIGGAAKGDGEVGRLALGEHVFIIALANESPSPSLFKEMSRFRVLGRDLVVLEAVERGSARGATRDDWDDRELASRLTGRELEIAVLVARGYATKNIGYRLQISEWTVATYLKRIFAKLRVYSRAQMVYRCASLIDRIGEIRPPARANETPHSVPPAQESKVDRHPAGVIALSRKGRDKASAVHNADPARRP